MRLIAMCAAALLLAACSNSSGKKSSFDPFGSGDSGKATVIVVTDFSLDTEVPVIDRGFAERQEKKPGNWPILERRARAAARVNDEIVATIVALLQEAGYDAQPGSAEAASGQNYVLKGLLRRGEKKLALDRIGFGAGRGNIVAEMSLGRAFSFGSDKAFNFVADQPGKGKPLTGPAAAARNEKIAAALVAVNAAPEKLSPDVEGQARRLAQAIAEKAIAYGKEQSWTTRVAEAETPAEEAPLPKAKPDRKPAKPAAKPKAPDADDKPEE
jgi:hypothetical protein